MRGGLVPVIPVKLVPKLTGGDRSTALDRQLRHRRRDDAIAAGEI